MRRLGPAVLASVVLLAGCAVPHTREVTSIEKVAATEDDVVEILDRLAEVRSAAVQLLDAKPLSTVETGPVLAIDTGAFEVASAQDEQVQVTGGSLDSVEIPRFGRYPLWLLAVVRDEKRGVQRLQVFERSTAVDPWLLVAAPEALLDTTLPELRRTDGAAVPVASDDDRGLAMSPEDAAATYAAALRNPEAPENQQIDADDGFVQQMREAAATNAELEGVEFDQAWSPDESMHVLRAADGGALVFATLLRTDRYTVDDERRVTFPEDSPQGVFLSDGIQGTTGTLDYYHQVLIQLPPGNAKPRVVAQLGGVVRGGITGGAGG